MPNDIVTEKQERTMVSIYRSPGGDLFTGITRVRGRTADLDKIEKGEVGRIGGRRCVFVFDESELCSLVHDLQEAMTNA